MTFANPVRAFEFTLYIGVIPNRKGLFKTPLLLMLIPKLSPSYIFLNSMIGKKYNWLSCIQQEIIQLFLQKGCRMADNGEFTMRAFLNGKMDLSQAEAVADVIASNSAASHQMAIQQMRGGITNELKELRAQLLDFAALIELELDFSGEDVEFADRSKFKELVAKISFVVKRLIDSFAFGNAMKNGIPVAIIGEPNVGKSTLLNTLLNEEKAIVSEIAGTTRDAIEDKLIIEGVAFRFIDTAGIRQTEDVVENIGIKKTYEKAENAQLIVFLLDSNKFSHASDIFLDEIETIKKRFPTKRLLVIANKTDTLSCQVFLIKSLDGVNPSKSSLPQSSILLAPFFSAFIASSNESTQTSLMICI